MIIVGIVKPVLSLRGEFLRGKALDVESQSGNRAGVRLVNAGVGFVLIA
jgi:hypothetical protein